MKLEGRERVPTPLALAWERINDPDVLRRCTPGLARLEETRPDHFEARIELRLPAVRGDFDGSVDFLERRAPEALRLRIQGKGAPGFVNGEVTLELRGLADGTEFSYAADVQVGGQIARLGQRMVSGVVKDMAAQFFYAFARIDNVPADQVVAHSLLRSVLELAWRALLRLFRRG